MIPGNDSLRVFMLPAVFEQFGQSADPVFAAIINGMAFIKLRISLNPFLFDQFACFLENQSQILYGTDRFFSDVTIPDEHGAIDHAQIKELIKLDALRIMIVTHIEAAGNALPGQIRMTIRCFSSFRCAFDCIQRRSWFLQKVIS